MEPRDVLASTGHTAHALTMPAGVDASRLVARRGLLQLVEDQDRILQKSPPADALTGFREQAFGRTPRINRDQGREHWGACYSAVLAGGGVGGGQVYGASDKIAAYPQDNPVAPEDLLATVYQALGIPSESEVIDRQGRPLKVCEGKAVEAIFG
jgi:hypothetical protein